MSRDDNPRHCCGCGKSEHEVTGIVALRSGLFVCGDCTAGAHAALVRQGAHTLSPPPIRSG